MTEFANTQPIPTFLVSSEHPLPNTGTMKYIHMPKNNWFGVDLPESIIIGDFNTPHRSIIQEALQEYGIQTSISEIQHQGYINAGIMRNQNNGQFILIGNSGGLESVSQYGTKQDMMRVTPAEKIRMDETTIAFLQQTYPSVKFFSLASV